MKSVKFLSAFVLGSFLALTACNVTVDNGEDGDGNGNNKSTNQRVDWGSVSSDYHPQIQTVDLNTFGAERIYISAFGFNNDVELIYSQDVQPGTGSVKLYKVWQNQASFGSVSTSMKGRDLNVSSYGSYKCSIKIKNSQITDLDGGCIVRMQIFMPVGARIEVYNAGQLLSERFFSIDNQRP